MGCILGIQKALSRNRRIVVSGSLLCAWFFLLSALLAPLCLAAEEKPVIALVTEGEEGGAFEGLLLAELTARETFRLVERDEIWRAHQEMSTMAGFNNALRLGARLKAHALLMVTGDEEKSVRLVETTRGVILAQWLLDQAGGEPEKASQLLADALVSYESRLLVPADARVFVSMRRHDADAAGQTPSLLLSRLNSLVAFKLSRVPWVFLVERENFAAVNAEADPGSETAGTHQAADAVITARAVQEEAGPLRCTYQVQVSGGGAPRSQTFEIDYASLEDAAEAIAQFLEETLSSTSKGASSDRIQLRHEAALYRYMATTAGAHHDYVRALPLLELACLLWPDETAWRTEFVRMSLQHLKKNAYNPPNEKEYMAFVHWLRQAVGFQLLTDRTSSVRVLLSDTSTFHLLTRDVRSFQTENRYAISCLRSELRALLPKIEDMQPGNDVGRWITPVAPVFFDEPEPAIAFLRDLLKSELLYLPTLYENIYQKATHWDQERTKRLWLDFLREFGRSEDVETQAVYYFGLCFFEGAFEQEVFSTSRLPAAREAALELFQWMDANPAAHQWVISKGGDRVRWQTWRALGILPIETQEYYYRKLMLPLVRLHPEEERNALYYARVRWHRNVNQQRKPDDAPAIRQIIEELYKALDRPEGETFSDWLKPHLTQEWVAELFGKEQTEDDFLYPDIPDGRLVFDSGRFLPGGPRQREHVFEGFNGYVDANWLWLAWGSESSLGLARIDLASKDSKHFLIPVGVRVNASSDRHPFVIARFHDSLCVADHQRIHIVPLREEIPVSESGKIRTLGPQIGPHMLGRTFEGRPEKNVSALVECGKYLYIALDQPIADGSWRNLYGAIYRWDGQSSPEQITASDSLDKGPLNNCLPYHVFAAFTDAKREHVYFALAASVGQPESPEDGQRNGIWEYNVEKETWRQIVRRKFGFPPAAFNLNQMRPPDVYDFGDYQESYRFFISEGRLERLAGAAPCPGVNAGFKTKYSEKEDGDWQNFLYWTPEDFRETADIGRGFTAGKPGNGKLIFRVDSGDFHIQKAVCREDGYYVLLSGMLPGGGRPTSRGLVYFVPFAHE